MALADTELTRMVRGQIGRRYIDASLLEAHLLDFDDLLYGERARVRFVRRLRGEERFESADALVDQMERDVAAARRALGG